MGDGKPIPGLCSDLQALKAVNVLTVESRPTVNSPHQVYSPAGIYLINYVDITSPVM